jgi:hypothetical protein
VSARRIASDSETASGLDSAFAFGFVSAFDSQSASAKLSASGLHSAFGWDSGSVTESEWKSASVKPFATGSD